MSETNGYLRFETNVPQVIALKFAKGLPVEGNYGDQMMFTLVDGRKMYLNLSVADRIAQEGIRPGQPFLIVKKEVKDGNRKATLQWVIEPQSSTPAAPPASQLERDLQASLDARTKPQPVAPVAPAPAVSGSNMMRQCVMLAIDALIDGAAHAEARGLEITFSPDDIRAMAISIFIGMSK